MEWYNLVLGDTIDYNVSSDSTITKILATYPVKAVVGEDKLVVCDRQKASDMAIIVEYDSGKSGVILINRECQSLEILADIL